MSIFAGCMDGTIELTGMEFHAYHGCLEEEKKNGNRFIVDLSAKMDISVPAQTDNLSDAVDYGKIYDLVALEMAKPSNLLENVAGRIAESVRYSFPEIRELIVKVSKQNPPVKGKAAWSSVSIKL